MPTNDYTEENESQNESQIVPDASSTRELVITENYVNNAADTVNMMTIWLI